MGKERRENTQRRRVRLAKVILEYPNNIQGPILPGYKDPRQVLGETDPSGELPKIKSERLRKIT